MKKLLRAIFTVGIAGVMTSLFAAEFFRFESVKLESNGQRVNKNIRNDGVEFVKQISKTTCRMNRNYGWNSQRVWVDDGCRAIFRIKEKVTNAPRTGEYFARLDSEKKRREMAFIGRGKRVTLQRQFSKTSCRPGKTWGYQDGNLWVDKGCRAVFAIR